MKMLERTPLSSRIRTIDEQKIIQKHITPGNCLVNTTASEPPPCHQHYLPSACNNSSNVTHGDQTRISGFLFWCQRIRKANPICLRSITHPVTPICWTLRLLPRLWRQSGDLQSGWVQFWKERYPSSSYCRKQLIGLVEHAIHQIYLDRRIKPLDLQ